MSKTNAPRLYDYFVLINPPNWINWEVENLKYEFATNHGGYPSEKSPAHISLMHFTEEKKNERKIVKSLEKMASKINSFDISLDGFDFFDSNNTFYIDIESKGPVVNLQASLLVELDLNKVTFERPRAYTPHITIGRKLTDSQFRNAFHEFSRRRYTNYFRVNQFTLLKRPFGQSNWKLFKDIPLNEPALS